MSLPTGFGFRSKSIPFCVMVATVLATTAHTHTPSRTYIQSCTCTLALVEIRDRTSRRAEDGRGKGRIIIRDPLSTPRTRSPLPVSRESAIHLRKPRGLRWRVFRLFSFSFFFRGARSHTHFRNDYTLTQLISLHRISDNAKHETKKALRIGRSTPTHTRTHTHMTLAEVSDSASSAWKLC